MDVTHHPDQWEEAVVNKYFNLSPKRQVITNGFFTKDPERMAIVAKALGESGVNSLLLSVDAFHREHIPMDQVHVFAKMLCGQKIADFTLHPAWVVNRKHENPFNLETETCLQSFSDLDIPVSDGNENPFMKTLLTDGARGLMDLAEAKGFKPDASQHFSACGVCREIVGKMQALAVMPCQADSKEKRGDP